MSHYNVTLNILLIIYELLFPRVQMHKPPPPILFIQKWAQMGEGGLEVLPQKILNLVDVISCILVHFWDGQLEKGNT